MHSSNLGGDPWNMHLLSVKLNYRGWALKCEWQQNVLQGRSFQLTALLEPEDEIFSGANMDMWFYRSWQSSIFACYCRAWLLSTQFHHGRHFMEFKVWNQGHMHSEPGWLPPVLEEARCNKLNPITKKATAFDSEFSVSFGSLCALSWFPRAQHLCWAKHRGWKTFYLAFFFCLPVSSHPLRAACFLSFPEWMWSTVLCDPTPDACTPSLLFARTCRMLLMDFLEVEHFPLVLSICHQFSTDFSLFFSFVLFAPKDIMFWHCIHTICHAGWPLCSVSAGVFDLIKIWGVSPITECLSNQKALSVNWNTSMLVAQFCLGFNTELEKRAQNSPWSMYLICITLQTCQNLGYKAMPLSVSVSLKCSK